MKRFKDYMSEYEILSEQVLTEKVQAHWIRSAFMHMMNSNVMITDNIYKKSKQDIPEGHTWHTTSAKRFKDLVKIQRSKKTISARPKFYPGNHVWNAGYTCKLYGQVLFGMDYDLMSVPDESGRRWIPPYEFFKAASYGSDIYDKDWADEDWQKRQIQRFRKGFAKQLRSRFKVPTLNSGNSEDIWVFKLIKFLETQLHFGSNSSIARKSTPSELKSAIRYSSSSKFDALHPYIEEAWDKLKEKASDLLKKAVADWIRLSEKIMSKHVSSIKKALAELETVGDIEDAEFLVNQFTIEAVLLEPNADLFGEDSFTQKLKERYKEISKLVPSANVLWVDSEYDTPSHIASQMEKEFPNEYFPGTGYDYYELDMYGGNLTIDKVSDEVFEGGIFPK